MIPITILKIKSDNTGFEMVGQINSYESLVIERIWNGIGEFRLKLNANTKYAEKLEYNYIIIPKKDYHKAFIIEYKKLTQGAGGKGEEILEVKGRSLTSILKKRILYPLSSQNDYTNTGKAETIIKDIVDKNFITTTAGRKINLLKIENNQNRGNNTSIVARYTDCIDEITKLANTSSLGFRIDIDVVLGKWIFKVLQGINRVATQSQNRRVIFSAEFNSIQDQEYTRDRYNTRTQAIVGGEGTGISRVIVETGNKTGLDREELFIDAGDIPGTDATAVSKLSERGNQELVKYKELLTLETTVLQKSPFKYEEHWDLGDFVTVMSKKWVLTLDAQIVKVEEIYESGKIEIKPTFGNNTPSLISEIKKRYDKPLKEVVKIDDANKSTYKTYSSNYIDNTYAKKTEVTTSASGYAFSKLNSISSSGYMILNTSGQITDGTDFTCGTDRITCNFNGVIEVAIDLTLESVADSYVYTQIRKNGSVINEKRMYYDNDETDIFSYFPITLTAIMQVQQGNYVQIYNTISGTTVGGYSSICAKRIK
ncbi:MAG: hypothetical protein A2Y24_01415 [Clostridiales bacterium GWE2_32_10]|nr:MAG: hypothetical protein A2Y24_01415 [Clostridiales bacterium GWE2_32_10]HBY19988.1 hypothetical protein [Clostridiales bacterium]